jgi:leader peptidase (prepilin peptidase) / N-methyltransferase
MGYSEKRNQCLKNDGMRESLEYLLISILSTSICSFYTTLGLRITDYFYGHSRKKFTQTQKWKQILSSPSSCEFCYKKISILYLFPFLGYFFSKGKCIHCNYKIPYLYPLIEFIFLFSSIFVYYKTNDTIITISYTILWGHFLIFMITDHMKFVIDYENLPFIVLIFGFVNYYTEGFFFTFLQVLVLLSIFVIFLIIHFLSKGNFGLGDVLLISTLSFGLDHPYWIFFFNGTFILAISISFIFRKKNISFLKQKIPLGVYMGLSAYISTLLKIQLVSPYKI